MYPCFAEIFLSITREKAFLTSDRFLERPFNLVQLGSEQVFEKLALYDIFAHRIHKISKKSLLAWFIWKKKLWILLPEVIMAFQKPGSLRQRREKYIAHKRSTFVQIDTMLPSSIGQFHLSNWRVGFSSQAVF